VSTIASQNQTSQFRTTLVERHQQCIVPEAFDPLSLVASHLIPRRLGDAGVQFVFERFTGSSTIVDRFSPLIGVPLFSSLNAFVGAYKMSFWNSGPVSHPSCLPLHSIASIFCIHSAERMCSPQFWRWASEHIWCSATTQSTNVSWLRHHLHHA
jgi:hypothetical protein